MKGLLALLLAGVLLLIGACSSSGATKSSNPPTANSTVTGSITVLAAASLTETFTTLKQQVEAKYPGTTINLTFGASSDLSTQITQGKPADVFASASNKNMTAVVHAGNATKPVDFVSNTLEIAVPPSNPGKITQLADLAKPGVKVGVCAPAVPCGVVAAKVFANAKLDVKASANLQDVKSTLAVVESGEVDAGLVYVTDVRSAGNKVNGILIPDDVNASTTYPIVVLKDAKNAALAKAFVDYVLSPAGQQVLTAGGFKKP
ncbi:MAG: molybdate ABC transporter substrate-binding protein [Jatrophihabitans sp.]